MVAAALMDRPAVEQPCHGHERGVEDRHRQDEHGEDQRGDRGPGDLPARDEAERGKCKAEHLASRVAHEHERAAAAPEVERQEAEARESAGQSERERRVVGVHRDRVDGEEEERDRGERRSEAVHVVEQVERVRKPDQPDDGDRISDDLVVHELDVRAAHDHDRGGGALRGQLGERPEPVEVVDEAADEHERDRRVDPDKRAIDVERAGSSRCPEADAEACEDPDPAEARRVGVMPAILARDCKKASARRRAQKCPDHAGGDRQGEDRHGGAHRR